MPQAIVKSIAMKEAGYLKMFCNVLVPCSQQRCSVLNLERFCRLEDCEDNAQKGPVGEDSTQTLLHVRMYRIISRGNRGPPTGAV